MIKTNPQKKNTGVTQKTLIRMHPPFSGLVWSFLKFNVKQNILCLLQWWTERERRT